MSTSKLIKFVQQLAEDGYAVTYVSSPGVSIGYNLYLRKPIAPEYKLAQVCRTISLSTLKTVASGYEDYLIYELDCMRKEIELMEQKCVGRKQRKNGLEIEEMFIDPDEDDDPDREKPWSYENMAHYR